LSYYYLCIIQVLRDAEPSRQRFGLTHAGRRLRYVAALRKRRMADDTDGGDASRDYLRKQPAEYGNAPKGLILLSLSVL
jgi:hypothetical protein